MGKLNEEDIIIAGHPRSGNNYIDALISKSFFDKSWIQFDSTHDVLDSVNISKKYVYIYRSSIDVLKSVFVIRKMFCLDVENFHAFLRTTYKDMWKADITERVHLFRFDWEDTDKYVKVERTFYNIDKKPLEYHLYHLTKWNQLAGKNNNIILISYDNLLINFDFEMCRLADFLCSNKTIFINVNQKVGWYLND